MRPIRLTLQAFGPFAGTEIINFEQASNTGLFGIYGPTGAGKTSIFDGLCFALFGESSGTARGSKDFRSDHADLEILTEVELVFDLGEKRYVIHRIPLQERKAKRGDKFTTQPHQVWLFDATGMDLSQINSSNRGRTLGEKKTTIVDKLLEELLGYSASQFRQIILLPQGQFRQILDADTKARALILEQLFDVSHFKMLQENLKEKARESIEKTKRATEIRDDRLKQSGYVTSQELEAAIEAASESVKTSNAELIKAKAAETKSREILEQAKAINARFEELQNAKVEHEKLSLNQSKIDELKGLISKADRAKNLLGFETSLGQSKAEYNDSRQRLEDAKKKEETSKANHQLAIEDLKSLQSQAKNIQKITADHQKLTVFLDSLKASTSLKLESDSAIQQRDLALTQHKNGQELQGALKAKLELQKQEATNALTREKQITTLEKEIATIDQHLVAINSYTNAKLDLSNQNKALNTLVNQHSEAKSALQISQLAFDNANAELSSVQALHLAANLEDGSKCPVCGSLEHPELAKGDRSSKGRHEAFEKANQALKNAAKLEREINDNLIAQRQKTISFQGIMDGLEAPTSDETSLNAQKNQYLSNLKDLKAAPSYEAVSNTLLTLESKLAQQSTELDSLAIILNQAQSQCDKTQGSYDFALAKLPQEYRDPIALSKEIENLNQKITSHQQKLEKAELKERELSTQLGNSTTSTQEKSESVIRAQKRWNNETASFETELTQAGFDNASFLDAKTLLLKTDKFNAEVKHHETNLISINARIQLAETAVLNTQFQDLAPLQNNHQIMQKECETRSDLHSNAQHKLKTLCAVRVSVEEATKEIARLYDEYGPLGGLAEVLNGENPYKLKLSDFAIAAMFEDVLHAANLRLGPMTDGRFELQREAGAMGGRAGRGLDILIFDAYTESIRPTSTLSGGEGFLASLALALGLSDVVQEQSGGVKLDALFIDEGFGSLDSDTLDLALQILQKLADNDRLVGIISHVDEVKRAIPQGFSIEPSLTGSRIKLRKSVTAY